MRYHSADAHAAIKCFTMILLGACVTQGGARSFAR